MNRLVITGATGSLGGILVERFAGTYQILAQGRDERKLAALVARFPQVTPIAGDLRSPSLLDAIATSQTIIHAAGQKYTDRAERDCFGTLDVNVNCTKELATLAAKNHVSRFLFISSDKAAQPSSVYAMTKHFAERLVLELAERQATTTFIVCRLSNIFGSSGSVARLWVEACRSPNPTIRVTDLQMTRFMLSAEQVVALLHFALTEASSGDILIPKCRSVALSDLLTHFPQAQVSVLGTRPGERIHEVAHPGGMEAGYEAPLCYVLNRRATQKFCVPRLDSGQAEHVSFAELRQWVENLQLELMPHAGV